MSLGNFRGSTLLRSGVLAAGYAGVLLAARWLAFQLRFDFGVLPPLHERQLAQNWVFEVPLGLLALLAFGQYSSLLSCFSLPDAWRVAKAVGATSGILLALRFWGPVEATQPLGVLLVNSVLSFLLLCGFRVGLRQLRSRSSPSAHSNGGRLRRVAILGAGNAGATLVRELINRGGHGLRPVALFDDAQGKWRSSVHGVPVLGAPELLPAYRERYQIEEAVIAMPSATAKRLGELVKLLNNAGVRFATVPSLDQLATGKVRVSQLRKVEIQDLLGREPVQLATETIRKLIQGQTVAVTGAGGSIGAELCRQVMAYGPRRLFLLDQCEPALFQIEQELIQAWPDAALTPCVADILDERRMRFLFSAHRPTLVFHAAAHKHVPLLETQPGEAIKNNTAGSARLAHLCLECGVERLVLISTDKAINPSSVMGATKRLAEMYLQALWARHQQQTKFMAVRFGNVLGSSGSVIPTFTRQIETGGPVTVTHPEVMRYFMTIPEAVGLVLQAAAQGRGGEIFVLDMGKPVKILDLARQLIELNGLKPETDIEIKFTGLRPGEKLFEEISHRAENITVTEHPKILRLVCQPAPLEQMEAWLDRLMAQADRAEVEPLKRLLQEAVPEYTPYFPQPPASEVPGSDASAEPTPAVSLAAAARP